MESAGARKSKEQKAKRKKCVERGRNGRLAEMLEIREAEAAASEQSAISNEQAGSERASEIQKCPKRGHARVLGKRAALCRCVLGRLSGH